MNEAAERRAAAQAGAPTPMDLGDEGPVLARLLRLAIPGLREMYTDGGFAFTRTPAGLQGRSPRYSAIVALGMRGLPAAEQRMILRGETANDLISGLVSGLGDWTNPGDIALVCWAAAEAGHPGLDRALNRLGKAKDPVLTVEAAWQVCALAAAGVTDARLDRARARLLGARQILYPHTLDGSGPWYRTHVGSFADQVYPIQALARLGDSESLDAAEVVAEHICAMQGPAGQWWWHYDARRGDVVEGYPVYSVHQHAMAPMALLDLADAGGTAYHDAIRDGLRWMAERPETREPLILDGAPPTWRKVARGDPRKAVRGVRALTTRVRPGLRLTPLDRMFRPASVDRECRPYELGWLLYAWLTARTWEGQWNGELRSDAGSWTPGSTR